MHQNEIRYSYIESTACSQYSIQCNTQRNKCSLMHEMAYVSGHLPA